MIKRNIPNAITCGNLVCGVLGVIFLFSNHEIWAAYCIFGAAILDFFDGFAARLLRVSSAIGKDLDSLADAVTFGVLPALILYKLLQVSTFAFYPKDDLLKTYLPYIALSIAVFSVIRLAKFNNDTRQNEHFIGVPTPANGMLVAGILTIVGQSHFDLYGKFYAAEKVVPEAMLSNPFVSMLKDTFTDTLQSNLELPWFYHPAVAIAYCIIMSFLLVSPLQLFALKFKSFGFRGNEIRYLFLLISLFLLLFLQLKAVPLIIVAYILLSIIISLFRKSKTHEV
jgi:CDP-diacylglycerol---serine O-phosphatidyltransferase